MSHRNKGFSQTSKQYDGSLKAQQQQSRNKQSYHSPVAEEANTENVQAEQNVKTSSPVNKKRK